MKRLFLGAMCLALVTSTSPAMSSAGGANAIILGGKVLSAVYNSKEEQ